MDPNDPVRRHAPPTLSDVETIRAERDLLARRLAEEGRRVRLRRDRFEAELDRRDRRLEHEQRRVANRDKALEAARAELAMPLVSALLRVTRFLPRVVRRVRRATPAARTDPVIDVALAALPDAAAFRTAIAALLDGGTPAIAIVGAASAGDAAASDDTVPPSLARAMADLGWRVAAVRLGPGDPRWDRDLSATIVVSPGVACQRLPATAIRVAWVEDEVPAWLADGLDDYDLVVATAEATAALITGATAQRPIVVEPGASGAALRQAISTWVEAPRIAIHIPPTTWEAAATWGDTAFARGLQRAFASAGWAATVLVASEADDARAVRADIALHLSGVATPAVRSGQPSILWIISHPDRVRASRCAPYDLVFVASEVFAQDLAQRVERPVLALSQATDPERFFPDPSGPPHELLFVGNSRGVRRPVLDVLLAAGRDVAVYGGNWKPEFVDPAAVRGTWIPNADLHRYYSSAAVVLSDHWEDMRAEGFISNRVYDALASGAYVVSDRVVGMAAAFDGAVAEYDDDAELLDAIDRALADPDERRERADRGRAAVLSRHTFEHRVHAIIDAVAEAGIWPRRP